MYFRDNYHFLSNMYPVPVTIHGTTYSCAESAYQAQKCPDRAEEFVGLNGFEAKKLGKTVQLDPNFEEEKDAIMRFVVESKFTQNPILKAKLLAVDEPIVEDNTWGDTYWGKCNGKGLNKLGEILTDIKDAFSKKYYTGIGSRQTPPEVLALMKALAQKLESEGYILRTGNAEGADAAFASGTTNLEMFYPQDVDKLTPMTRYKVMLDAVQVHPLGKDLLDYAHRKYLFRDGLELLGKNYDSNYKSQFVVCWTPDAAETGGTAQAMRLAKLYDIPVYNLADDQVFNKLFKWVNK